MKLQHYLGGLEGLPELTDLERRVFVEEWEKRIFGIHVAMMGLSKHLSAALPKYPIDQVPTTFAEHWTWAHLRTGAEAMDPFDYFKYRYYEKWLGGITQFLIDRGYLTGDELASRQRELGSGAAPTTPDPRPAIDDQVTRYLRQGDSPRRDVAHPRFAIGDRVRITNVPVAEHTRLPGHLRGKTGTVERIFEGDYAYFVETGDGIGSPMPVYIVAFEPSELFGPQAETGPQMFYAELFEAYLEGM
ncbi:nitrile hydratase subunit beta [Mycobacterium sp. NPDC048908]|uniref:nitrile hydratase subunit beta n=1 Tax=Mycobacterium sp. NPDC048908 TaxID=3364292 RepID=UPI00371B79D3